jgi:hypothetical protein
MGEIMAEDDIYIGGLLDQLNVRFGPSQGERDTEWFGGINEMAGLQSEFDLFKQGRSFRDSAAVLNIGGEWNARVRNRWLKLLNWLSLVGSNVPGRTGDEAIVDTIIENLGRSPPSPIYFAAHYSPDSASDQVTITHGATPLFYIATVFITISIPMRPKGTPPAARPQATRRRRRT